MGRFKYIPITLFVIISTMYDLYAPPQSVGWSIFYFTGIYVSLLFWCIFELNKSFLFFGTMIMGLFLRIIIELSKIGIEYREYLIYVNKYEQSILIVAVIVGLLSLKFFKKWQL